jgi:tetratricopeptide (TPR) repeat protein
MLTDGPRELPARLQTLRSAIAWSYDLLTPTEQALFRELSAFTGGCTLAAAESVCLTDETSGGVLEHIAELVDKSLLRLHDVPDSEPRYALLDTLREYAAERLLASTGQATVQERHALEFLRLAEEAEPHLASATRDMWLRRLEADYENLRTCLGRLLDQHQGRLACRLAGALRFFWYFQGGVSEGRRWLERALECADAATPSTDRAKALSSAGHLAWLQGDQDSARLWLEEGIVISRDLGNRQGLAYALIHMGYVLVGRADTQGLQLEQEGLALTRELGDTWWSALALHGSAVLALTRGDSASARTRLEESLGLWQQLGDAWFTAQALNALGDVARSEADYDRAAALYSCSLALLRERGITTSAASVLHNLGYVAHHQADDRRAVGLFMESLEIFANQGDHRGMAECLVGMAVAMPGLQRPLDAARLFGAGEALLASIGSGQWPTNVGETRQAHAALRAQLSADAYASAYAAGRTTSSDESVRYARELVARVRAPTTTQPARAGFASLTPREREIAKAARPRLLQSPVGRGAGHYRANGRNARQTHPGQTRPSLATPDSRARHTHLKYLLVSPFGGRGTHLASLTVHPL